MLRNPTHVQVETEPSSFGNLARCRSIGTPTVALVEIWNALNMWDVALARWDLTQLVVFVKLDDTMTPGIRRTQSVPQDDPCGVDLLDAALEFPATGFCEVCQSKK